MERNISENDLQQLDVICMGSCEKICKMLNTVTGEILFLKEIRNVSTIYAQKSEREMCAQLTLIHPNIIKLHQVIMKPSSYIFLAEFIPNGSLYDEIKQRSLAKPMQFWTEEALLEIWKGLVSACKYLQEYQCAHRKLQPRNILKVSDLCYKLSGFESIWDNLNRVDTKYGANIEIEINMTLDIKSDNCYLSPEVRDILANGNSGKYNPSKSDVYVLGLIFLNMASLYLAKDITKMKGMKKENSERISELNYSDTVKNILTDMLRIQAKTRPGFSSIFSKYFLIKKNDLNSKGIPVKPEIIDPHKNSVPTSEGSLSSSFEFPKKLPEEEKKEPERVGVSVDSFDQIEILNLIHSNDNPEKQVSIFLCKIKRQVAEAIAKVYKLTETTSLNAAFELSIIKKYSGRKNVFLNYYGSFIHEGSMYIIFEYVPGSLRDYITKPEFSKFTENQARKILEFLLKGYKFLEKNSIVHCDIKPANILLTKSLIPKIIDFGLSQINSAELTYPKGTMLYGAPEISELLRTKKNPKKIKYNLAKADSFSLGLTILDFLTKEENFGLGNPINSDELMVRIENAVEWPWAKNLIKKLTNEDPDKRCSMARAYSLILYSNPNSLASIGK